jgi:hypothetical protein
VSSLTAQVSAELQGGDAGFGLANQIEALDPSDQRELVGLHDRAGRESGLMAVDMSLITV